MLVTDGIDSLLTPAQASQIFDVTPATIRKWSQLGKIQPAGLDEAGRKLYRLIDIARYEKQTRHRAGRTKRLRATL
ncbi:MerR-like transcriptional regulator [Gordonia phage Dorito]|uniref:Excise n=2 Tax=Caudoviricetes TaxID=2731619 RepID=A0A3S9UAL7_9CAUD|nr:MerR-like transcriptional regulator [Gordonia phage Powerball]YP_010654316.1 MerR-like transcriptional regulator [Gordonia phage Dorito]AZS07339.1 excise [Gordonia phage Dorito]QFG13503.1 MerR-like helix-turn-helix DNA binding protein [Gordonia phage Powerball]